MMMTMTTYDDDKNDNSEDEIISIMIVINKWR